MFSPEEKRSRGIGFEMTEMFKSHILCFVNCSQKVSFLSRCLYFIATLGVGAYSSLLLQAKNTARCFPYGPVFRAFLGPVCSTWPSGYESPGHACCEILDTSPQFHRSLMSAPVET